MRIDDDLARLAGSGPAGPGGSGGSGGSGGPGFLGRLLAYATTAALLVFALMFSVLVFSLLGLAALLGGGYLWWKTRGLRRQFAAQAEERAEYQAEERTQSGIVIEGEVLHESDNESRHEIGP